VAEGAPGPATGTGAQRGRVVFVDFGQNKVYALADDGGEVLTFGSFEDLVERLRPTVIVVDSLPGKLQNTAAELAKTEITFLRLKNLGKLSEERKNNGVKKTDENDVRLLKTLYHRHPEIFQPLFTTPEELEVRALTELWVEIARMKMDSKRTRTETNNSVAVKIHKNLRNNFEELAREIHEKALRLPLYRRAVDELGLKGPALAYIISHDAIALTTLPRDRMIIRYAMTHRNYRKRPVRSQLLILLARVAVLRGHPRYSQIYHHYRQKGKKHWPAILRVAVRLLRDLRQLREDGQQTQKAGPPAGRRKTRKAGVTTVCAPPKTPKRCDW